ncbi:S-adenosyl-L-methionine-dependent methyltransferase [Butyriboletus roseoflavus]|nr:S-adenosyl-L-methionine-dependent methyltransferase [Butyriboletus roseoflavus]
MSQAHHDPLHDGEALHAHDHHDPHTPHTHPPSATADAYETANKHHFDAEAHQYDERPGAQEAAEKIGRAMRDTGLFKQGITTVMDFACGTGLISRVLAAEDPKSIVGVDISQGMVDRYNKIVSDHGIPPEEMRAICTTPHEKQLQGMTFDVIVCASAYHHLTSIDEVTQSLVTTYLNPGGSLLVSDIVHGELTHEIFHKHSDHVVPHKGGFTEEEIRSTFEKAGLKNFTFEIIAQATHVGGPVDLFLARGDK